MPLIAGIAPPEPLVQLPTEKVIALTVSPQRLMRVRSARQARHGGTALDYYVHCDEINKELRYAQQLIHRYRWRSVDVSYMAVEEVATQVLQMIGKN